MSKRVAILQSSYIPWKGYFDIVHDVDEFIFLDDVQYTIRDWRSRNRIKTPQGTRWLSIPVGSNRNRRICDVPLPQSWQAAHRRALELSYGRAPFFASFQPQLDSIYGQQFATLSELNQFTIRAIAHDVLRTTTVFRDSREFSVNASKQDRLLEILRQTGAAVYVSGPAAKSYIDGSLFALHGIELVWKEYGGYPEYPQLYPPFVHEVSVLDLLFHVGHEAPRYIWGWRDQKLSTASMTRD